MMKSDFTKWLLLSVMVLLLACSSVLADVSTVMFQNNMVLQRRMSVPVFGTASPGEEVTVTFRGQTKTTQTGADGKWQLKLDPMEAGGPFEMIIKGRNTLSLTNVMVGEVWLCAGQSNMGYSMKKIGGQNTNAAAGANFPDIRIRTMAYRQRSQWDVLTPDVCLKSSATAYYFGTNLYRNLGVPVGLIVSSSPGTAIRYWLDPATIAADPKLAGQKSVGKWYNELVSPVIPYGIRGAIWYQGESDVGGNAQEYRSRFQSLINHYRKNWNEGDFPFIYVQIASFGTNEPNAGAASPWAELREAQTQTLSLSNTAMAVTIDIGAVGFHPEDKWDLGKRLALPALRLVYGRTNILEYSGPVFRSGEAKDGKAYLHFDHISGGLIDKDASAFTGFALCGADGQWRWARAVIQDDTVVLACDEVKDPMQVRYAWADYPIATPLYNGAGLPAVPFEAELQH
ncbi:MAG TPA: sialate O-acetylesterase [Pseudomonadales bacterium]|nr:sialate O-acetylesterase [Pseudomonadales bacterium]